MSMLRGQARNLSKQGVFALLALATVAVFGVSESLAHQQTSPSPTPITSQVGVNDGVARGFTAYRTDQPGTLIFQFAVLELDPEILTSETGLPDNPIAATLGEKAGRDAGTLLRTVIGPTTDTGGDFVKISVPQIGDWTHAWVRESDDGQIGSAIVVFGDGVYMYLMMATGIDTYPLDDLISVARASMDDDHLRVDDQDDYRTDGIWGRLPRLEDLPPGFVFETEWLVVDPAQTAYDPGARSPYVPATPLSLMDIVVSLESAGLEVNIEPHSVRFPLLSVPGQLMTVEGSPPYIFIYRDNLSLRRDLRGVQPEQLVPINPASTPSAPASAIATPVGYGETTIVEGRRVLGVRIGGSPSDVEKITVALQGLDD